MKRKTKLIACTIATFSTIGFIGCGDGGCMGQDDGIKLTVWVSEADRDFATQVANEFKASRPDKKYNIVIDIQGENDVSTRVLKDVENAADVYSCLNDQLSKLINGDALAQIAGDRLTRIKEVNSADAIDSVTMQVGGKEGVYGMPYTDNTFFLYYNKSVL